MKREWLSQDSFQPLCEETVRRLLNEDLNSQKNSVVSTGDLVISDNGSKIGEIIHVSADGSMGFVMANLEAVKSPGRYLSVLEKSTSIENEATEEATENKQGGCTKLKDGLLIFRPKWFNL